MRQLIVGNWKMNGLGASLAEIEAVAQWVSANVCPADVLICPPATLVTRAVALVQGRIAIGGQDCHAQPAGAFTGDVSAEMLGDAGAAAVIVGHSERRQYHGETNAMVTAKARAAWRAGLVAIICIGECESDREAGRALDVVTTQLRESAPAGVSRANTAIAYEPVWAIGTGRTPTLDEIAEMHNCIRMHLGENARDVRILYGGSVRPDNAKDILALSGVDGALVGGASLKARDFQTIIAAADNRP